MLGISKNKARLVKIRQDSSIYAKMSGQKFKKKIDICIVSKYYSSDIYYLMYFNMFILQIIMSLNCIENNNIASKKLRISIPQNAKSCPEVGL